MSDVYGSGSVYSQKTSQYTAFTEEYWSAIQSEVDPHCIFIAPDAEAVPVVVLTSRLTQCPFAIKSGGHAAFPASSIEGGITVSLENLKNVTVSADKKTAVVQPGNVWVDVYKALTPHDVTVAGGRVATVGTGGLTLGGGISFFSSVYGWACDNVVRYEVVTASGTVVNATATSHQDLYWALRGGGNNFGIVTAFEFETIPLPGGEMWGGTKVYLEAAFDDVNAAFHNLAVNSPDDPNAGMWLAWASVEGVKLASVELYYAKAQGAANSTLFKPFNEAISVSDTTQQRTVAAYAKAKEEDNSYGLREVYWAMTTKANVELGAYARDIFYEKRSAVDGVANASPVLLMQPITEGMMAGMSKNGGNPLGIKASEGPLYLMQIAAWWDKEDDDDTMYAYVSDVVEAIMTKAEELGVANDYIYMNYGSMFQNVIAGYGPDNVARLKDVARHYDPDRVFQTLTPGHYKLDRAPVPNSGYYSGVRG